MLPKHTRLAAYLCTVPGLIYRHSFKYSFPNTDAWSRHNERLKRDPLPAVHAHDLAMPIYLRVEDISFNEDRIETAFQSDLLDTNHDPPTVPAVIFRPGTWAIIKKGRYKGDLGITIEDDYNVVDTSSRALLKVIPRVRTLRQSKTKTHPPKAPLPIDFNLSPHNAWKSFLASKSVTAICIEESCNNAWECDHEENWQKRYRLFGQTIRGGFVLYEVPLDDLQVALRVSDEDLTLFETIAEGESLGRVPPLASWTFQEKEAVILMRHLVIPAALPGTQFKADLGAMADGVEGSIEKVYDFVCDVNFTEKGKVIGQRSVPYNNLVKKLSVGQTVRLAAGVRDVMERKWVQRGNFNLFTIEETRMKLANADGLIASVFTHPAHGPSVSVWVPALSLIVNLSPNSVVEMAFTETLSSNSSTRPTFPDESTSHSEVTTCDIRDVCVAHRGLEQTSENNSTLTNLHPQVYFSRGHSKFKRIPWLGVRVYVAGSKEYQGWTGKVRNVEPDRGSSGNFSVLVQWYHSFFGLPYFHWYRYEDVRRSDNHGLLHEFTPYTGISPWKGTKVKVIQGVHKDRAAEVQDSRADPILDLQTVSGISLLVCFDGGIVTTERHTAWIDYHYIRQCDTKPMLFLHESGTENIGLKSYYAFKLGYKPRYSAAEIQSWDRPSPAIRSRTPETPLSLQHSPSYFRFEAPLSDTPHVSEIPHNFWLLDQRLWKTLGNRQIEVARSDYTGDLRLSVKHLGNGAIIIQSHETRTGGSKKNQNFQVVHPGVVCRTPWTCTISRSAAASGLYLICDLEPHTGKLARHVRFNKHSSGEGSICRSGKFDQWLLQVVSWTQATAGMDHVEMLVNEPMITTTRDHFVLVHESLKTVDRGNELMCRLRLAQHAPLNGYAVNEAGQVMKVKEPHPKRKSKPVNT